MTAALSDKTFNFSGSLLEETGSHLITEPARFVACQPQFLSACSAEPMWALNDFDHRRRTRNEEEQAVCGPLID